MGLREFDGGGGHGHSFVVGFSTVWGLVGWVVGVLARGLLYSQLDIALVEGSWEISVYGGGVLRCRRVGSMGMGLYRI